MELGALAYRGAPAKLGAKMSSGAAHIWNNPPATSGERFNSGHAAAFQMTRVKTAYKQDHV